MVLALDADRAGREAMLRAQRVAGSGKLRLLVAAMPEGEDPADLLAIDGGEERFRRLLAEAVDLPVFHARAILADASLQTPAGRDKALDEVVPVLGAMGETITRQELLSEIADRLDTDPAMIARRLASGGAGAASRPRPEPAYESGGDPGPEPDGAGEGPAREPVSRRPTTEERREGAFLAMCIANPERGAEYIERLEQEHLVGTRARAALPWLKQHLRDPLEGLPREDEALFAGVSRLVMLAEHETFDEGALELTWLILDRARIDREIARLRREGTEEPQRTVDLQRERARIADAIATRSG